MELSGIYTVMHVSALYVYDNSLHVQGVSRPSLFILSANEALDLDLGLSVH